MLDVVAALAYRHDGLVDGQLQRMPCHPLHVAHPWHHVKRAVDGEGHNGQLDVVGKHEGATLEHSHVTRERACSLGEHHERHASLKGAASLVVSLADAARSALVHEDVVGRLACLAHEGYLAQLTLHHPLEVAAEEAVDEEDVEGALVVSHEYV